MPRPSNTIERRQQIIEGLMFVMSEAGYDGATIPLIAQAAGLTPGLVHYHFENKQAILIALLQYIMDLLDARFQKFRAASGGPERELAAFIDAHVALDKSANAKAVACWISIGAEAVRQPEVRAAYRTATREQLQRLEDICKRLLKHKQRSASRSRQIAMGILSAIEGAYRLVVSAPELVPQGFASPTIKTMAMALIKAEPKK